MEELKPFNFYLDAEQVAVLKELFAPQNARETKKMIDLEHVFKYHAPSPRQQQSYSLIRTAAMNFAAVIVAMTPAGADQEAAIRKVREAVMTANASIALGGRLHTNENDCGYATPGRTDWNVGVTKDVPRGLEREKPFPEASRRE
jgi:hypothetical protein